MSSLLGDLAGYLRSGTLVPAVQDELSKYANGGASALATSLARYLRLWRAPLPRPGRSGPVLVTLTSLPSRVGLLRPVLASLLDQTVPPARVVLALPEFSQREQTAYRPPAFLDHPAVEVLRCERDWGPATKLIPAWQRAGPDRLLLALDDDNIYPDDLIERLLHWHQRMPGAALGLRGWSVGRRLDFTRAKIHYGTGQRELRPVDVLTGTWGFLIRRDFFDDAVLDYSGFPEEAFSVDDVWFSGHLARRGVPRRVISSRQAPLPTRANWVNDLARNVNCGGQRDNRVLAAFAPYWERLGSD